MAESITINPSIASRKEKYEALLPQIKELIKDEPDIIANLSNIMAALKYGFGFFWTGCYFVKGEELVLGPFQGPVACSRIFYGKGVCGKAWQTKMTVIVDDINKFEGHISCSAESQSEIVVPVFNNNADIVMVIDIDSDKQADFDETDQFYLERLAEFAGKMF